MLVIPLETSIHADSGSVIKTFDIDVQIIITLHQYIIHSNTLSNVKNLPSLLAVTS